MILTTRNIQYQYLADKYAPEDSEIASTLAKLQLPPDLQISAPDRIGFVPLPPRNQTRSKQQTAVAIRDGRRAAQKLTALGERSTESTTSGRSVSGASSSMRFSARRSSLSTVLEQDFTVPGKKSSLLCPFAPRTSGLSVMEGQRSLEGSTLDSTRPLTPPGGKDPTPHLSADPICAALYAETMNSPPPSVAGSAAKCPIRYLDQHSPEEVARYFETHKHEIPRSHEVCVRRYQRNEDDIRKLDAKYGNLVSMIQGLGQKHQPMLPSKEEEEAMELEHISNERVENWAKAVSTDGVDGVEEETAPEVEDGRESRFDRPLKEIRVGESPSRPWGISVPIFDPPLEQRNASPVPAPVAAEHIPKATGKCPFGHGQGVKSEKESAPVLAESVEKPAGKCPFGHGEKLKEEETASKNDIPPIVQTQPTFIQAPDVSKPAAASGPQMIFTGPVFIGYPLDQAMALMQQWKSTT
jgi:hypothetical protein